MIDYILQTRLRICLDHQASLYFQVVFLCKKMTISNYSIDDQILNMRKIIYRIIVLERHFYYLAFYTV